MTAKLSIAIITFNEASNIRRTLESVKWADEIVVVDSGSTDGTVDICREYTDSVFSETWQGFSKQKNSAIEKASADWVLSLDADEEVEPALAQEIREIISSPNALDAYRIPRKTVFLGKWVRHGGWYPDYNLRLFRRGKGRFTERAVHEALRVDGVTGRARHAVLHHAYPDLASFMNKMNTYSTLAVEVLAQKGIGIFATGWFNILFRPAMTFVFKYFVRLGFLDGKRGLILNLYHAYYVFAKYAKAWEYKSRGLEGKKVRK